MIFYFIMKNIYNIFTIILVSARDFGHVVFIIRVYIFEYWSTPIGRSVMLISLGYYLII